MDQPGAAEILVPHLHDNFALCRWRRYRRLVARSCRDGGKQSDQSADGDPRKPVVAVRGWVSRLHGRPLAR